MDAATADVAGATGFDTVMPMTALPEALSSFIAEDRARALSVWSQMNHSAAKGAIVFVATALGSTSPLPDKDVHTLIRDLRSVKSPAEIELIRKATEASMAAQRAGMRAIEPGVHERTVAGIEIAKMMEGGCERPSYAPVVGSGINSATLDYGSNQDVMKTGDVAVIDAAGEFSMYASDITRTMPVNGKFTARQRRSTKSYSAHKRPQPPPLSLASPSSSSTRFRGRSEVRTWLIRWTKSPLTTSTHTARTPTASRSASTFCMVSAIPSASTCTTPWTSQSR